MSDTELPDSDKDQMTPAAAQMYTHFNVGSTASVDSVRSEDAQGGHAFRSQQDPTKPKIKKRPADSVPFEVAWRSTFPPGPNGATESTICNIFEKVGIRVSRSGNV